MPDEVTWCSFIIHIFTAKASKTTLENVQAEKREIAMKLSLV